MEEIGLNYCFEQEAYREEERALQSRDRLFPNDDYNGNKEL